MTDWCVIRLVYDDYLEYTGAMHRWLAEVVCELLGDGWQYSPARGTVRRARIVSLP